MISFIKISNILYLMISSRYPQRYLISYILKDILYLISSKISNILYPQRYLISYI